MSTESTEAKETLLIPRIRRAFFNNSELELTLLLGLLRGNASERSKSLLIDIFRSASGVPKEHLVYDHEAGLHQRVTAELKSQSLSILSGFTIDDLDEAIVDYIPQCHPHFVSVYLQVAAEKKMKTVFNVLATLADEMIEDIGNLYFDTLYKIDSAAAIEWAWSQLRATENSYLFSASIDLLERTDVDVEGGTLTFLQGRTERIFSIGANRELPFLYPLIARFQVLSCAQHIADRGSLACIDVRRASNTPRLPDDRNSGKGRL